jgi:hypothetical protein
MTKDYDPLRLASQLEQFETTISDFAPIVCAYYQALIENGLPEDLAYKLVTDWHAVWWTLAIGAGLNNAPDS